MRAAARSRDDSKRETREALVQAGIAAFAERGLDAPSLDAICARAGYTRGAFYVHFHDRDDFLVAVMERVLGTFFDAIIATGDAAHDLERTVGRFAGALTGALAPGRRGAGAAALPLPGAVQFHRLLEACARSPDIRKRFGSLMQEAITRVARATASGQSARTVRGDVDPAQVGLLLVGIALGGIAMLETAVPFDPEAASRTALRLLARRPARV